MVFGFHISSSHRAGFMYVHDSVSLHIPPDVLGRPKIHIRLGYPGIRWDSETRNGQNRSLHNYRQSYAYVKTWRMTETRCGWSRFPIKRTRYLDIVGNGFVRSAITNKRSDILSHYPAEIPIHVSIPADAAVRNISGFHRRNML